jgi:hypothetical protein
MVSLGGGIALNLKPNPFSLSDLENWIQVFMWKLIQFSFFFLVGSHMGENFKTEFDCWFSPKWELLVLNVSNQTENRSENWVTQCELPNTGSNPHPRTWEKVYNAKIKTRGSFQKEKPHNTSRDLR